MTMVPMVDSRRIANNFRLMAVLASSGPEVESLEMDLVLSIGGFLTVAVSSVTSLRFCPNFLGSCSGGGVSILSPSYGM